MTIDADRLQRLLGQPAASRIRRRLQERLAREDDRPITLTRVSDDERAVVERLLGRPPRSGDTLRVSPSEVDKIVRQAGIAPGLRAALEALDGPIRDAAADRDAENQRWAAVFSALHGRATALGLAGWLTDLQANGLLKRSARHDPDQGRALLEQALAVLEALPAPGLNRSTLAARCLGDAHALDKGRPVAALVRQALQRHWRGGVADDRPDERTLWAHAGILVGGDITSTVLLYQFPVTGDSATARMLDLQNAAAQPTYLTLRQLLRAPPQWDCADMDVYICENPAVVSEAAEQLSNACAPLVATFGRPRAAFWVLLEQLARAGARLHYRADFDWAGISIMNGILARFRTHPWRMDAATLQEHAHLPGAPLVGRPVAASWDTELKAALQARGQALQEEQIIGRLLADLAIHRDRTCGG